MSNAIDSFATLFYSPYKVAPLIAYFYENISPRPKNILLSYFVLPLALTPASQKKLKFSKKTSNLSTFTSNNEVLHGMQEKVGEFKSITNKCLLLLIECKSLALNDDLSMNFNAHYLDGAFCPDDSARASRNLGKVLNQYDVPSCYRAMGLKRL